MGCFLDPGDVVLDFMMCKNKDSDRLFSSLSQILEITHLLLVIGVRFAFRQSVMLKNARKKKRVVDRSGGFCIPRNILGYPSQEDKMGKHEIKVKKPHKEVAVEWLEEGGGGGSFFLVAPSQKVLGPTVPWKDPLYRNWLFRLPQIRPQTARQPRRSIYLLFYYSLTHQLAMRYPGGILGYCSQLSQSLPGHSQSRESTCLNVIMCIPHTWCSAISYLTKTHHPSYVELKGEGFIKNKKSISGSYIMGLHEEWFFTTLQDECK